VHEFEWSNKVVQNHITALSRQLSGKCRYDPIHINNFRGMATRFFDWFFDKFETLNLDHLDEYSLFDYAESNDWPKNKREMY